MTSSVAVLARRIDRLLEQIKPRLGPKTWELLCEAGAEIPDDIIAGIGLFDEIVIREYPAHFMDDSPPVTVAWYEENGVYYVPDGQGGYKKVSAT